MINTYRHSYQKPFTADEKRRKVELSPGDVLEIKGFEKEWQFNPLMEMELASFKKNKWRAFKASGKKIKKKDFCPCGSDKKYKDCCMGNVPLP